jgi:hypothetical protein
MSKIFTLILASIAGTVVNKELKRRDNRDNRDPRDRREVEYRDNIHYPQNRNELQQGYYNEPPPYTGRKP